MPDGFGDDLTSAELGTWSGHSMWEARQHIQMMTRMWVMHLREDHGYSIKHIADKTGIKFSRVREILNG